MNKRCFLLLCLFCTAFSQSALGMVMSLRSVVNKNNKRVVLIAYEGAFRKKGISFQDGRSVQFVDAIKTMQSEPAFFPNNCEKEYFPYLHEIVEKQKRFGKKKIDFFVMSLSNTLFLSAKNGAFVKALNDNYFKNGSLNENYSTFVFIKIADPFFEYLCFYCGGDCKESFKGTTVSDRGVLMKNGKKFVFPKTSRYSVVDQDILEKSIQDRIKNVSFFMEESSEIVNWIKTYCEKNHFSPSDEVRGAIINVDNLILILNRMKLDPKASLLDFFAQVSNRKLSLVDVSIPGNNVNFLEGFSKEKYLRYCFSDFSLLRRLFLILRSQCERDVTVFVLPEDNANKVYRGLKHLGYKDYLKGSVLSEKWRPIPPVVFKTFLNRVLKYCNVCGKKASKRCNTCKSTYCSPACQKKDWKEHKKICKK